MSRSNVTAIARDDHLLRRVLNRSDYLEWHDDFNRWIPSLASVRFDPDGMSAFVARLLMESQQGPEEVSTLGGTSSKPAVVYEVELSAVEECGFTAKLSPNEDTPIGHAHSSIPSPGLASEDERSARTDLAGRMVLCFGSIALPKPHGA